MIEMLKLSEHLPEVRFAPGQVVLREGDPASSVWILVSGTLRVVKGDVEVNAIAEPGALVGEMSALLGSTYSATIEATSDSVLRHSEDGPGLLADPAILRIVAVGLAQRLRFVTTYLADLKHQYGDAPGLTMVSDVLRELSYQRNAPARPGSARDPDPEY